MANRIDPQPILGVNAPSADMHGVAFDAGLRSYMLSVTTHPLAKGAGV